MKKKKKKYIDKFDWKKYFIIAIILIVAILIIGIIYPKIFPYYKVDDKVSTYLKYKKENKDNYKTIGWLKVQGTNIDYPVIYSGSYDITKIENDFVWTNVDNEKLSNKVNILGHNILNLSSKPLVTNKNHTRFEQLMSFIYYDFVKKNKYVQYTFNGKNYLYKIFSVSSIKVSDMNLYHEGDYSSKELKEYINKSLDESYFDFNVDVNKDDKLITLFTCTRMFGMRSDIDFRIDARLVRKNEAITNYSVNKNDNYKKIDSIMEGGNKNEKA